MVGPTPYNQAIHQAGSAEQDVLETERGLTLGSLLCQSSLLIFTKMFWKQRGLTLGSLLRLCCSMLTVQ